MPSALARHRRSLVVALGAAAVLVVILIGLLNRSTEFPMASLDAPGPALPVLAGTDPVDGGRVSTADFAGRPLIINMWASWCEGCRVEAPDIRRFVADRDDVTLIGLDVSDEDGAARRFVEEYGWTHRSIRDPRGTLAAELDLQGLPTTVYVWPDGRIAGRDLGEVTYERLQSVSEALTGPAPTAAAPAD